MNQAVRSIEQRGGAGYPREYAAARSGGVQLAIVSLDNHAAVAAAYGAEVAENLRHALIQRVPAAFEGVERLWWEGNRLFVLLPSPQWFPEDAMPMLSRLLEQLAAATVRNGASEILPRISVVIDAFDGVDVIGPDGLALEIDRLDQRLDQVLLHLAEPPFSQAMRTQYRFDMACAATIAELIERKELMLAWQPIVDGEPEGRPLYHEGLLRLLDPSGEIIAPGAIIEALERIGLVRGLDAHVVGLTIDRLCADPGLRLGCNISAQSAIADGWWHEIFAMLEQAPDVAARLVIEITESSAFVSINEAVRFADRLRRLGCTIALDDFGAGHAAFRHLQAIRPHVVKIDGRFVKVAASGNPKAKSVLANLIALGTCCAAEVVAEGIDTDAARTIAMEAGAHWLQGFHIGMPALVSHDRTYFEAMPNLGAREESLWLEDAEAAARIARHNGDLDRKRRRFGRLLLIGGAISLLGWCALFAFADAIGTVGFSG